MYAGVLASSRHVWRILEFLQLNETIFFCCLNYAGYRGISVACVSKQLIIV